MKKPLLIVLFLLFSFSLHAEESVQSFFYEGNRLYGEGEYQRAIDVYEAIVQKGGATAALYYNLGNSYYKLDQKGKALLFYKRALKLNPRDQELYYNIRLVKAQLKDKVVPKPENRFARTYWELVGQWSLTDWSLFCLILYLIIFVLALIHLFFRSFRKVSFRVLITFISIGILLLICWSGKYYRESLTEAIILSAEVQAHYGPSEKDAVAFTLHEGTECLILESDQEWAQIQLADGKIAWLPKKALERI